MFPLLKFLHDTSLIKELERILKGGTIVVIINDKVKLPSRKQQDIVASKSSPQENLLNIFFLFCLCEHCLYVIPSVI